jgi:hypothetical protein
MIKKFLGTVLVSVWAAGVIWVAYHMQEVVQIMIEGGI